jgi:hypothetical protein
MGPLDIPEILIVLGIAGCIAWALHNWRHRHSPGR